MLTEVRPQSINDFDRHPIALKGEQIRKKFDLPSNREATLEEVEHCPHSFFQLLGRNGGETKQFASLSFGLAGGVTTLKPVMESIGKDLVDEVKWYGDENDQVTFLIETEDIGPEEMLDRLIDGPSEIYKNLKGLKAQAELQKIRRERLLAPKGKARFFLDIFYGRTSGQVRGYQEDGTSEFCQGWEDSGQEFWARNMDDQPQSWSSLALDPRVDHAMRDNLLDVKEYLAATPKGKKRFVVKGNADKTVFCCGNATNAQLSSNGVNVQERQRVLHESYGITLFVPTCFQISLGRSPLEKSEDICTSCKKSKKENKCTCKKD